jgi:hypothetical protein
LIENETLEFDLFSANTKNKWRESRKQEGERDGDRDKIEDY